MPRPSRRVSTTFLMVVLFALAITGRPDPQGALAPRRNSVADPPFLSFLPVSSGRLAVAKSRSAGIAAVADSSAEGVIRHSDGSPGFDVNEKVR